MKNFIRSVPGKTFIFILLIICCIVAGTCIIGEIIYWDTDMYYFTEDTYQEQLMHDMVRSKEDDIIWNVSGPTDDYRDTDYINRYYGESRTNLLIQYDLITPQGEERIYSNTSSIRDVIYQSFFIASWDENGFWDYQVIDPDTLVNTDDTDAQSISQNYYRLKMGLKKDLPIKDEFQLVSRLTHYAFVFHNIAIPVGVAAALLSVLLFIALLCVSARRPNTDELVPGVLNWVPFDVLTLIVGAICSFLVVAVIEFIEELHALLPGYLYLVAIIAAAVIITLSLIFGWCMSLASRIKQRNLFTNTLCWKILSILFHFIQGVLRRVHNFVLSIPFIWKGLILWGIYCFILILVSFCSREIIAGFNILTAIFLLYCIYAMFKINRKAKNISNGYYEQSSDGSLILGFRDMDQSLSQINSGLSIAVEQRMKSERMKTELITNVSHDIKTPLTSIINYADLIGKEKTDNTTIKEYADVLHRQSEKLKRLIDDLIEASKASTGNIELNMERCDLNVIIPQITGEYNDRLNEMGLSLITKVPEEPVLIMADGRRLWRVFDNLMGNILKYSLPGTRVYITMVRQNGEAIIVFKNTSRDPIDLTPEELTERFVRGDESRNTEGNGLGLSIAKSLVELQGGAISLYADGDLFKVILRFPLI